MNSIIRRFDRAPLDERLLRANQAQPPKGKTSSAPPGRTAAPAPQDRNRRGPSSNKGKPKRNQGPQSAFAEELAKAL
jgi:hypothetical protein